MLFQKKKKKKVEFTLLEKKRKENPKLFPNLVFLGLKTHKVFGKNNIINKFKIIIIIIILKKTELQDQDQDQFLTLHNQALLDSTND